MSVEVVEMSEQEMVDRQLNDLFAMSGKEFHALKVTDRDMYMFLLVRELAGAMRVLQSDVSELRAKLEEYETKAKELMTPEGQQMVMDKVMSGMMGGGLLGGRF